MEKKISQSPEFKKLQECSFQALKRQCLNQRADTNSSVISNRSAKNSQYLQVNYLKGFVYKISPQKNSTVPLIKQEQNFREYLTEIQTDQQRLREVNCQIKHKYFTKSKNSSISRQTQRRDQQIRVPQCFKHKYPQQKNAHLFSRGQRKKISLAMNLKDAHSFTDNVESVKFIAQAPEIMARPSLPFLNKQSTDSFTIKQQNIRQKTHHQINNSMNEILEKSAKYQSQDKLNPKKLRSIKSRSQFQKETQRKIKTQRKSIIKMMQNSEKKKSQKKNERSQAVSLDDIPARQKYSMDFISYVRTKTKSQLEKYIYEKLVKQPERDLQKFQQFMLKEVKFQSQSNKNNIQRFFIKMREQFRKIQKYHQKGSKFDWRSKSLHLNELKNEDNKVKKSKFYKQKKLKNQPEQVYLTSQSKKTFLENLEGKRLKSKADRIMSEYIRAKNQEFEQKQTRNYLQKIMKL